ncbi:MAG: serine/threonine protein kinase, partial [Deltaproteobacteria bacterium]|nr:serine/threonine protein kinase [Deltaproteobacteria bacterium]
MQALGRYELLRPLARGGMAEVFLARRRAAGVEKRLVIKRILAERARDPRFVELFVREARLSMALAHQNIVPVFDFGRIGDALFLAMEHVEGHDLGRTLARAPRLPPVVAAFVAAECCQALDHAHHRRGPDGVALGIVHRDVTPRNVLVSDAGDVKLVDFGVAALGGDGPERVRGTPAYMAPEQARGDATDGRADLYALGLVLWEMLTGERARRATDVAALLAEARSGVLPPVPVGVPPALVAVLTRATAAAPGDRYPEAHAMFDDLDSYVVATRAADPASEAPKRRLAAWLRAAWVGDNDAVEVAGEMMAGPVVTFIDDGVDAVIDRTARSLADTVGDGVA